MPRGGTTNTYYSSATTVTGIGTTGTWTCPTGVTAISVGVYGGGAGGGSTALGGGGGGGGAYSAINTIVTVPTSAYTVVAGAFVGAATNGQDSWFLTSSTVFAKGGVTASVNTGGVGGASGSGIGDTKYSGGGGGNSSGTGTGGGGGSGGGPSGIGGDGFLDGSGGTPAGYPINSGYASVGGDGGEVSYGPDAYRYFGGGPLFGSGGGGQGTVGPTGGVGGNGGISITAVIGPPGPKRRKGSRPYQGG